MKNRVYKHNSRSYYDIYNALVQAYPNKPTWLFKEMAALFDFQSELMNRIATDILSPKTRESAYAFAARCDYEPAEADGSTTRVTFTLTGPMTKTIPAGYQVGGMSAATGDMIIFEVTEDTSTDGSETTITANVKQKQSYTEVNIGTVTGQDDYMDFPIEGYRNIIKDSVKLLINSMPWNRVENFDDSTSESPDFRVLYQSGGKCRILFGDGVSGKIPEQNSVIYADFSVTKGLLGRMGVGEININSQGDPDISSLTNDEVTAGGSDSESVASIIRNARANVRLRNMVWTLEDLETTARAASSSVQKAHGIPGVGTAIIHIVPKDGGDPSDLLTTVEDFVKAKTQFGIMPVTVSGPNYMPANITASITVKGGYTTAMQAVVKSLTEFSLTLASCAFDNQVIEYYDDYGIDRCRTDVINISPVWTWNFSSDENNALAYIIEQWKSLLGTREYRQWEQPLEAGDLWIMGNGLYDYGVDIFNLTAPTGNVNCGEDEIINTGSVIIMINNPA